jgi:hypothetical protein
MTEQLSNLQNRYCSLLPLQYQDKPNANSVIKILTEAVYKQSTFALQDFFKTLNLDSNEITDYQLGVIAKIVGVSRFYNQGYAGDQLRFKFTGSSFFNFKLYNPTLASGNVELTNEQLTFLIKLKITKNYSRNAYKDIVDICYNIFNGELLPLFGNMEMSYIASKELSDILLIANSQDLLLKPLCVKINGLILRPNADTKFFGFGLNGFISKNIAGFGAGYVLKQEDRVNF